MQQPDYSKPRSLIAFKFDNEKAGDADGRKDVGNLVVKHNIRISRNVAKALEQYKSMKINCRLHLTYEKLMEGFDGKNTPKLA